MSQLTVQSLFYYPVKSCAANSIDSAVITPSGILNDRRWMVVDSKTGKFVTQRKDPKLARIRVQCSTDSITLNHLDGDQASLDVPISTTSLIETEVWKDRQESWDQGQQVSTWLSEVLNKDVRLVYIGDEQLRTVDQDYAHAGDQVGFADGFPFLIASAASIEQFNKDLGYDISIKRFRPNIVISGDELKPYAEDEWKSLIINGIQFDLVKPCSRCVMPSINPETVEKERAVIDTLVATRKQGNATYFGQNAVHQPKRGFISVGDSVEVVT